MLLMVGVLLEIVVAGSVPLVIKAEPRPAILAFLVATVWEFVQIEYMVHLHERHCTVQDLNAKVQRTIPSWFRQANESNALVVRACLALLFVAAVVLYVWGSTSEVIRFTSILGGETEGCPRIYNLYTIATALTSDLFMAANSAKPGVWTLVVSYALFLFVFPLFGHLVHGLAFVFDFHHPLLATLADMGWTFASVEILVLSVFTVEVREEDETELI